ncbi:MAG: hypothetical protein ABI321_18565 [Polyangia bacterium]
MKNFLLAALVLSAGCAVTIKELHPHPGTTLKGTTGKFTLVTSAIADDYEPGRDVHLHDMKQTLQNAMQAAAGTRYSSKADPDATRLVFSELSPSFVKLGADDNVILFTFRASWQAPDGTVIADIAGNAGPTNPGEHSQKRRVEDAIEAMFQQLVNGLDNVRPLP